MVTRPSSIERRDGTRPLVHTIDLVSPIGKFSYKCVGADIWRMLFLPLFPLSALYSLVDPSLSRLTIIARVLVEYN